MQFYETKLSGAYEIELDCFWDKRGFFARTFCQDEFNFHDLESNFVQANISYNSSRGIWRGLHYQIAPYQEAKLVRCIRGQIYDVIVDLRPDSMTYCDWLGVELSSENRKMLYIPKNFAHGYLT